MKHANASRIAVTLQSTPDSVVLTVADDGKGFDLASRSSIDGHFGLRGLRTRARALGTDLLVRSSPGNGTTVQITVPLRNLESNDARRESQPK